MDGKHVPLLPRSQCLHLCNGDEFTELNTLQRVVSIGCNTGLANGAPSGEALSGMEALRGRDVPNLMSKCHSCVWNIRFKPNLELPPLLQTHTSPVLQGNYAPTHYFLTLPKCFLDGCPFSSVESYKRTGQGVLAPYSSGPQFPHLYSRDDHACPGRLWKPPRDDA